MTDQQQRPTKKERREAARAERLEQEQAAQAAAKRKKLMMLGGLLVAAVAVVVVAIVISTGGSKNAATGGDVEKADTTLFDGIPQKGIILGDANAPATMILFADAQCPYCRDFEQTEFPDIVKKYVRTGKAKVEFRLRAFLNENSVAAGQVIYAAAEQNKMFNVASQIYANQGPETGEVWATDDYLRNMLAQVPGVDVDKAMKAAGSGEPAKQLQSAETLAQRFGSQSTPEVYVGKNADDAELTGGATAADVGKAIDAIASK